MVPGAGAAAGSPNEVSPDGCREESESVWMTATVPTDDDAFH